MSQNMITSEEDFFNAHTGGGGGAPSFSFEGVGSKIVGTIVSTRVMDQHHYGTTTPIPDPKRPGQNKKQIQIVLSTTLRNWEGIKKTPTDEDGMPLPTSEDTGARAVYVKGWMIGAVSDAVFTATKGETRTPVVGARMGLWVTEERDTGKGNPMKIYGASYVPPAEGQELFEEAVNERTAPAPAGDGEEIEVPF